MAERLPAAAWTQREDLAALVAALGPGNARYVGGAVRDELLGLTIKERDWVVVNSSPEEMQSLGYQQVGKSFPVFLHPDTKEEYALARTEKKTGPGYTGFDVYYGEDVGFACK